MVFRTMPQARDYHMDPGVRIATPPRSLAGHLGDKSTVDKPTPTLFHMQKNSLLRCHVWYGSVGKSHNAEFRRPLLN